MPKSRLPHLDETGIPLKAYDNGAFLHSPDGRTLRVISEMHEPYARFKRYGIRDTIVFYGSARILDPKDAKIKLQTLQKEAKNQSTPSASLRRKLQWAQSDLDMSVYYRDAMKLAEMMTRWSSKLDGGKRFIVCSGGGPGIMEAANRGAKKAGGPTIGLNISLPFEQIPNPYISPELNFEFHYFFMRKFWFAYLAKALVVFPGGYGTLDELFELLTLVQTKKIEKPLAILIYGKTYWDEIVDFEAMAKHHMISPEDLKLFAYADKPEEAFEYLKEKLERYYLK